MKIPMLKKNATDAEMMAHLQKVAVNYREREAVRRAALTPKERAKEDRDHAAWEKKYERAQRPDADKHLVLMRVTIKRWNVIQWWLYSPRQDWKKLVSDSCAATVLSINIRNAMRTARAKTYRRPYSPELLARRVYASGTNATTLEAAMKARLSIHSRWRGETREIAYEYTGKRLREQQTFERRNPQQEEDSE